jgi:PhnB protein
MAKAKRAVPEGLHTVTPMLTMDDSSQGGSPISLWIYVEDADSLYRRATSAGARVAEGPMGQLMDQFWGDRCGTIIDPEGYSWTIATRKEELSSAEMQQRMSEWMSQNAGQPS